MSFTLNGAPSILRFFLLSQLCIYFYKNAHIFAPAPLSISSSDCIVGPVLTRVVCAHIINTITSARHVVMRNDDRIRAAAASADALGDGVRDQGYSRARVLVLVPFKCSAVRVVNAILDACPGALGDISGYDRFLEEFDIVDEVLRPPPPAPA
jgi:hypothetical protein